MSATTQEAAHLELIPDEEFVGPIFRATASIRSLHSIPRFGYPSDISLVASDTEQEQLQYLYGTTFLSLTVLLVFVVWVIYLVFCKIIGPYRAGLVSGTIPLMPFPKQSYVDENQPLNSANEENKDGDHVHHNHNCTSLEQIEEWNLEYLALERKISKIRVMFFACGVIVLAASFGLYISGFSSLQKGFLESKNEIVNLKAAIDAASEQLRKQHNESSKTIPAGELAFEHVEAWCPNVETNFTLDGEAVNDDVYNFMKDEVGDVLFDVSTMRSGFMDMYSTLGDMIAESSMTVSDTLEIASANAEIEKERMEEYIWWYGMSIFFLVALDILVILSMLGAYMASKTEQSIRFEIILSCIIFPTFSIVTVLSWILTAGVAVTAILTADACTGSPEKNLVAIFHEKEISLDPLLYSLTKYYVEDCLTIPVDLEFKPTKFVEDFHKYVDQTIITTKDFVTNTSVEAIIPDLIDNECGDSIAILRTSMLLLSSELEQLQEVTAATGQSLYCSVFTPIYANIMHDQVCRRGVDALSTMFFAMLVLTICCMIMITLRVATHTIEFYDAGHHEGHDPHDSELNQGLAVTGLEDGGDNSSILSSEPKLDS